MTTAQEIEHGQLYGSVREAIADLPLHFRTETHIEGVVATDLHTLNTVLGATIEEQIARTLNQSRTIWDPDDQYTLYSFVRQAQTFPDVLLRRSSDGNVLLGIGDRRIVPVELADVGQRQRRSWHCDTLSPSSTLGGSCVA